MAMNVEDDQPDACDTVDLLIQANDKAAKLLEQLLAEQAQMDQTSAKLSVEALRQSRLALAEAIAAVRKTIDILRKIRSISPAANEPVDSQ